ncbi:ABC transporter ATP-binding protein [Aquabacter spiritensis]|uniref:Amino acid/amide ABC transporter ATP-binding protein 2 (HAAT family) n=1 Tax=Aquabacter spiritensis TaxID=933073 RepID=A0A4R3LY60_9HYPH|nr:ABC transporter ATP-binding protein [Aquabacter spiritensis]TCT05463.1 amino acid/amide ABC transporter ATP-binding protein 2 (HAAT family) [Aquabacter spiritensis]
MNALEIHGLSAGYGGQPIVRDIRLTVGTGEIVALLGANGAGKTTTLRAASGVLRHSGKLHLDGQDISGVSAARRVALGLAHVPQGRGTFVDFSVEENLRLGAYSVTSAQRIQDDTAYWFGVFPRLKERRAQLAGSLSGGEQQMLAIARAMMTRPKVLMCDEPSLGLAPAVTADLFVLLRDLAADRGTGILIVEQNAHLTLEIAARAYVLEHGEIAIEGSAATLSRNSEIQRAYLGIEA